MKIENSITLKRFGCMLCSLGTIWCYSYLVGGTGGYLFGKGEPIVALAGFLGGTALAACAFVLWRSYLRDLGLLAERGSEKEDDAPPDEDH